MINQKFPKIDRYPISAAEYKEREKAYSSRWQIRFFFIGILAATTFFMPELITKYFLQVNINNYVTQGIGLVLAIGVMLLSQRSRKALARAYGLFCPQCGETFDYWSDKKNAVSSGGICPLCNFQITDIQNLEKDKNNHDGEETT